MSTTFRTCAPDQTLLFPPSPRDWLPEEHLAFFIADTVAALDLQVFYAPYAGDGRRNQPFDPQMMVTVLLYAYATGTFSSRRIARKLTEDVAYRALAAGNFPAHRTIAEFRQQHLAALEALFVQVVQLAREMGVVQLGTLAIDGSKVTSNNEPPGKQTKTAADAYAYSCNTYFAQLGVRVGEAKLRAMSQALGLTEAPPFALPTSTGRLSTDQKFLSSNAGLAASAYGQGQLQISPLELGLATAAIANGGVVPRPRLFLNDPPGAWRSAMSPETARLVTQMMVRGTTDGWAATAAIPGINVAAKTGSAEVAPGESSDALFIAFAPAEKPTIAVVVVKERGGAGSTQAGPVARAIIDAWIKMNPVR